MKENNRVIGKAVILAGGLGTRFLPITKSIPKEMLPILNKPALQYISEEVEAAGIKSLCIVINDDKEAVKRHYRPHTKLEAILERDGKAGLLRAVRDVCGVPVEFAVQDKPLGSGHAVLCAKEFAGGDDFALLNGDDVMFSDVSVAKQLCACFEKYGKTVIGVQPVPRELINKCGIVNVVKSEGRTYFIDKVMEKPDPSEVSGNLANLGRYVLSNSIFNVLENLKPAKNGEYQLTDAINILAERGEAAAYRFEGRRYDLGSKLGYMEANIEFGLRDPEIGAALKDYIKTLI